MVVRYQIRNDERAEMFAFQALVIFVRVGNARMYVHIVDSACWIKLQTCAMTNDPGSSYHAKYSGPVFILRLVLPQHAISCYQRIEHTFL